MVVSILTLQVLSGIFCVPHAGSGVMRERSTLHLVGFLTIILVDGVAVDVEPRPRWTVDDGAEGAVGNPPEMASPARGMSSWACFQ